MFKYTIEIEDYLIFYKFHYRKNNILFKPISYLIVVALATVLILTGAKSTGPVAESEFQLSPIRYLIFIVFLSGIFASMITLLKSNILNRTKKVLKANPHLLGKSELYIDKKTITLKMDNWKKEILKSEVLRINETDAYLYLYYSKSSAIIVPKTCGAKTSLFI